MEIIALDFDMGFFTGTMGIDGISNGDLIGFNGDSLGSGV